MPAFPQKLTWGYSELLPKSAPETAQNSRLMSKSGPFSCRTIQNSRVAAKAGRPPPKPSRTPGLRRMPRNRKSARQTRPAPQGDAGLASSRVESRNQARHSAVLTRPSAIQRNQTDRISRKALSQKRGGAKRLADFASAAPHRPHAAEPCAGKRPGALTPQSRCAVGARRPGHRRSRRPHTSR